VISEGQELPRVDAGTGPLQQTAWIVFYGLLAAAALYQLWLLFGGRQRRANPAVETLPDSSTGTDGEADEETNLKWIDDAERWLGIIFFCGFWTAATCIFTAVSFLAYATIAQGTYSYGVRKPH